MVQKLIKGLGWKKDSPDPRDHWVDVPFMGILPRYVNLAPRFPAVYNQGNLGSCTGNACAGAIAYDRRRAGETPDFVPSRLMLYLNARELEGTSGFDAGATIRDVVKGAVNNGACSEDLWPYVIQKFADLPPPDAYTEAAKHKVDRYARVPQTLLAIKAVLAQGFPILYGFLVYRSFMEMQGGLMPLPSLDEAPIGGHANVLVGYNSHNLFLSRNSWGTQWMGSDPDYPGYFWVQPEWLLDPNYVSDLWVINHITS